MELVAPCLTSNFEVFVLKFHHRDRRSPRCLVKIRHHLFKVLVGPLVCVALAKFWQNSVVCVALAKFSATTDLLVCDQLLDDELESNEWVLLAGNPVHDLDDSVKTITKE